MDAAACISSAVLVLLHVEWFCYVVRFCKRSASWHCYLGEIRAARRAKAIIETKWMNWALVTAQTLVLVKRMSEALVSISNIAHLNVNCAAKLKLITVGFTWYLVPCLWRGIFMQYLHLGTFFLSGRFRGGLEVHRSWRNWVIQNRVQSVSEMNVGHSPTDKNAFFSLFDPISWTGTWKNCIKNTTKVVKLTSKLGKLFYSLYFFVVLNDRNIGMKWYIGKEGVWGIPAHNQYNSVPNIKQVLCVLG